MITQELGESVPNTAFDHEFRDTHRVFHHKAVQDLYWSLYSPDLLAPKALTHALYTPPHTDTTLAWLKSLDLDPTPLTNHLLQHSSTRLGKYFEALWQFFLENHSPIDLCASNIQIHHEKRTLGELDFVIQDSDIRKHLELAVKFYLYVPELDQGEFLEGWVGPNCNDFLDRKLKLLENKQLKLPYTENVEPILREKNIMPNNSELVMKGVLFEPIGDATKKNDSIKNLADKHLTGTWLYAHQLDQIIDNQDSWLPLHKMDWMSPAFSTQKNLAGHQVKAYITQYFTKERRALQFLAQRKTSERNANKETNERVFVVPDDWPWVKA